MFEGQLAWILNKALGDYVENLDKNQLNLGIWGGDVVLTNLNFKRSALAGLGLPVQCVAGSLGKLILKVPWKNLYNSSIEATIEDLYLLVQPNLEVTYDEEKEQKAKDDDKQKEIQRYEFAKKFAEESAKTDPGFLEKLLTRIVKNVQVKISKIHIRYEDKVSHPGRPFAMGITLCNFLLQSTDDKWVPCLTDDNSPSPKIYKIGDIEALAVYWNSGSAMYSNLPIDKLNKHFSDEIATKAHLPQNYHYIIGPINLSSHLKINCKPELEVPAFSSPFLDINFSMEKLAIGVRKTQYFDLIALHNTIDLMVKGVPYRKYRPINTPYKGHAKVWWHFAYKCVLELEVRRRRRNWDWDCIKNHRSMCQKYAEAYKTKISTKKPTKEMEDVVANLERLLDVVNIVIIRQRTELELEKQMKKDEANKKGWFSGWWGGSKTDDSEIRNSSDLLRQMGQAMTPDEKAKLYAAIGYHENTPPAKCPNMYIRETCSFTLGILEVTLFDDMQVNACVILSKLNNVKCEAARRPAEDNLRIALNIDDLKVIGLQQNEFIPHLVTTEQDASNSLLSIVFETNPIGKNYGQHVMLKAQPLKIVYDAATINQTVDMFKVPLASNLEAQLQLAAGQGFNNIKEMSALGMQYAISQHARLGLDIEFHAPILIIPYNGKYTGNENVMVANLGTFKINTAERVQDASNVKALHDQGIAEDKVIEKMVEQSYDEFAISFSGLQLLLAQTDQDWMSVITACEVSSMHVLKPLNLRVAIYKCLITDDPRLPLLKIRGTLAALSMSVSDKQLVQAMSLFKSIPFPEKEPESLDFSKLQKSGSTMSLSRFIENVEKKTMTNVEKKGNAKEVVQFTNLDLNFVIQELSLIVSQFDYTANVARDIVMINAHALGLSFLQQTYNMNVTVSLKSLALQFLRDEDSIVDLISTPPAQSKSLFTILFVMVNKNSPEFHTKHHSCESLLELECSKLNFFLHLEALKELLQFSSAFKSQIDDMQEIRPSMVAGQGLRRTISSISDSVIAKRNQRSRKKKTVVIESIIFKLSAMLHDLNLQLANDAGLIASMDIKGLKSEVIIKKPYTQVAVQLNSISVLDGNTRSHHPQILTTIGNEAIHVQIVLYNLDKEVDINKTDIQVFAKLGKLRIVFINWFVLNVVDFLNEFQEAQTAIIEASQQAASNAKANLQSAYEKATRINMDIDLKAPDLIIPENSKSFSALVLSMGNIRLTNKFKDLLEIKNDKGHNVVLDEMTMALSDFQLTRALLNEHYESNKKINILQPLNINFSVVRNLTSAWYKPLPEVDVSGHIATIDLMMSQMDYGTIMNILSGNLTEGNAEHKKKEKHVELKRAMSEDLALNLINADKSASNPRADEDKVTTFLKFTFSMDSFIVNLYMCSDVHAYDHDIQNGLARFSLEGLSIKGNIFSDGTISTSLLLVNCLLDDTRKGRSGKLNRLMERKHEEVKDIREAHLHKSMLDMTVQIKKEDTFVDLRVYSFTIILSVDYLKTIGEFFTTHVKPTASSMNQANKSESKMSMSPRASTYGSKISQVPEQSKSIMTLNIKVERPDIVLVEHMDNMDTNALILNNEIVMKIRMSGDHQVISGTIKDIQLYTCAYDPAKRAETRGNVLEPVCVSIAGSNPENKGLHLEVHVTDIKIFISPATLGLLNRVYVTAMGGQDGTSVTENEHDVDYSNIWKVTPYNDSDYWFLRTEVAEEALSLTEDTSDLNMTDSSAILKEICLVSMPVFIVVIEAGIGNKTLPMLTLTSSFQGNIKNWSTSMAVEASLSLQMGYYNSYLATWEPLIEPLAVTNNHITSYVPWEIKFEMAMVDRDTDTSTASPTDEIEDDRVKGPSMIIDITSKTTLELTVTKTCLEVLTNLGNAFADAMQTQEIKATVVSAPYVVKNTTGTPITLLLKYTQFKVYNKQVKANDIEEIVLQDGAEALLEMKPSTTVQKKVIMTKDLFQEEKKEEILLRVRVNEMACDLDVPVVRADRRYFPLNYREDNSEVWGLISSIKMEQGVKIISLRSILQVHNCFGVPVDVYYMTQRGNELECIATVEPGHTYNVPFKAVYSRTNELFFSVNGYSVTTTPFIWKDLQLNISSSKILQCASKNEEETKQPLIIKAIGEMEQVFLETTSRHTMFSTSYNLYLRPAIYFQNCLPVNIVYCMYDVAKEETLEPGDMIPLPNVEPGKCKLIIRLPEYLEKEWSCNFDVPLNQQEFTVCQFNSHDGSGKTTIELGMHVFDDKGITTLSLYCPFWMINKTGLLLSYRKSKKAEYSGSPKNTDENVNVIHHPPSYNGPILFSFNAKNFFGKKKASIRIGQGEWSDKFSLDVAGSSGMVVCKSNNMIYQIGVSNVLTYNGLTKQITFTPYYVIINNSPYHIECQELERPADPWLHIAPETCAAIWPRSEQEDKLLRLRIKDTEEVSPPFLFTESHNTLLKLKNRYGGVNVDIQMTEGAIYINFDEYQPGSAPALIINHTRDTLRLWEKEQVQIRKLEPNQSLLYTWDNPSGSRILCWDIGNNKDMEDDLRKDDLREFSPREHQIVFWVSFLDGMQRVLLFTEDEQLADEVQSAKQFEEQQQEINVSIHGLGLSLVNNDTRQEIMYIGIASTGIIWQQSKNPHKRYKQMNAKDNYNLEAAYQQYLERSYIATEDFGRAIVDSKTEVDFIDMLMLKPHKRYIRRTFQTGLWMQMKSSIHQMQIHAKINRIQIDNQMFDCIFPVVLAPVPPPKSVAQDNFHKPFAELSIVQRLIKHSQIKQYKYFKVLIQEFHIKVDLGFINAVMEVLSPSKADDAIAEKKLFLNDLKAAQEPLYSLVSSQSLQEQKNFYDLLHFSPLKIHVSFSMAASGGLTAQHTPNFVSVLLQGLGVTLTDLQDVVFKLAFFERNYSFLTKKQLITEASGHYIGQSVKQLYVLVLGLDVLGNPYGLVIGITKGVEDLFYEPFQGAIQGPGEFAEGLVLGVRSLFGHTVGGAAGAVSRITGAMGKGIAALTFDKDYQRKRRDQLNKRPATVQEGFARGGKGLVMGVVDGFTGVFTKPISGAKEQGVEGFFKGLGKGAVGLVTRPTAGVIDFASGSLDAVKRVTEVGNNEVVRLRAPRFLTCEYYVRPYNPSDAFGNKLLNELEKGKYASTDVYAYHTVIIEKKEVLVLTDKRMAYITHNELFGSWQIDWSYTWTEIKQPATVSPKGVTVTISEGKKKKLGLFGSSDAGKTILIADPQLRNDLCTKIEELRRNA